MYSNGRQITAKSNDGQPSKKFIEPEGVMYADEAIAKIFELNFITGSADVLKDVSSGAISKSIAEKYYGGVEAAMGKRINIDLNLYDFQIAAVFEDVPPNADNRFHVIGSYAGFLANNGNGWPLEDWGSNTSNHVVYMLLPKQTNTKIIDQQLLQFEKKYNTNNKETKRTHFLQPLSKIHYDDKIGGNGPYITTYKTIYTLGFIGLLVILMACINFINLSTALAVSRSKEVGIRKVMGGTRNQLRSQVFAETTLVVLLAASIAVLLAWLTLPYIKNFMVVQHNLSLFNSGSVLFIVIITCLTIFLSAFYPAIIMGRFKPVEAIKNKINTSKVGSVSLRRVLVVMQFAFSQIFIIATVIAISQMNYIRNADLGFKKEGILILTGTSDSVSLSRLKSFKETLSTRADVKLVSTSFDPISSENSWQSNFAFDDTKDKPFDINLKMGDANYAKLFDVQMAAGRFYAESDTTINYVVNETFVKKCGLKNPSDVVGKMLKLGGRQPKPIVGVVKDFKMQSLREEIPPIAMFPSKRVYQNTAIKISTASLQKTKAEIEKVWNQFYPEYVFNASFFDENINNYYLQEQRTSKMYKVYAGLAIFISCLGLYGLISFMAVQKTKEVGIRKVLGASISSIIYLFSKEFTILILIAFLLAAPAAWYIMHKWLEDFVYRVDIGIGVFLIAIFSSVCIAWLTVGYKAFKAAIVNPVKSLRTE